MTLSATRRAWISRCFLRPTDFCLTRASRSENRIGGGASLDRLLAAFASANLHHLVDRGHEGLSVTRPAGVSVLLDCR